MSSKDKDEFSKDLERLIDKYSRSSNLKDRERAKRLEQVRHETLSSKLKKGALWLWVADRLRHILEDSDILPPW